jgi:hypothetical protein
VPAWECDLVTRADHRGAERVVTLERGVRVVHLDAGPRRPLPKDDIVGLHDEFVDAAERWLRGPVAPTCSTRTTGSQARSPTR